MPISGSGAPNSVAANGPAMSPDDKGQPPAGLAGAAAEQTADDTGDAGDAPERQHQQHGGKSDQHAAGKRDHHGIHGFLVCASERHAIAVAQKGMAAAGRG